MNSMRFNLLISLSCGTTQNRRKFRKVVKELLRQHSSLSQELSKLGVEKVTMESALVSENREALRRLREVCVIFDAFS